MIAVVLANHLHQRNLVQAHHVRQDGAVQEKMPCSTPAAVPVVLAQHHLQSVVMQMTDGIAQDHVPRKIETILAQELAVAVVIQ